MLQTACISLVAVAAWCVSYQGAPPATEVYLSSLAIEGGAAKLGPPVNISNSPGYDNQPSFTPDGRALLFTSVRGAAKADPANSAASGSDIYRYEISESGPKAPKLTQLTSTAESEYSPTVTPDGKHVSVVKVEPDGTQRLWRFPLAGGTPEVVLAEVKPVGYHAWIDGTTLALFVLGKPATLQIADVTTGRAEVVAKNIGRSLQRIPGGGVSFVQLAADASPTVMELLPSSRKTSSLVRVMDGVRDPDLAWTPDGWLLVAHGGRLHGWRRGEAAFTPLADLEALGLRGVSRMAVSPDARRIAVVGQP